MLNRTTLTTHQARKLAVKLGCECHNIRPNVYDWRAPSGATFAREVYTSTPLARVFINPNVIR